MLGVTALELREQEVTLPGLSAIDLFCGAGGLSAGFIQEGYEVALGLDNDEPACRTFAANFGETRVDHVDLLKYEPSDALRAVGGDIDVILGGPSCQPFSTHGRNKTWVVGDPRSDLWSRMHSFVEVLRPRAFILENVPGMLYYSKGTFVSALSEAFGELGYTLTHRIILAADYNVPQLRRRLIVVGLLGDEPFEYPEAPRLGGWRRDSLAKWEKERIRLNRLPHITLGEALAGLPNAGDAGSVAHYTTPRPTAEYDEYMRTPWRTSASQDRAAQSPSYILDHERVPIIEEVRGLAQHVPQGGTWRDIPPHLLPDRFRSMRRTDSTNLYGRMVWDRPAYTMTTQFQNITTGCFIHPDEDRPLTVREGARVQSFSDDFVFEGATSAKVRLIGNAVPPLLARALARQLRSSLESKGHERLKAPALIVGPQAHRGEAVPGATQTAAVMRGTRRYDTMAVESLSESLDFAGIVHRVNAVIDGPEVKADIVIEAQRTVLFVQGCFIHGCDRHARKTKSQNVWWKSRIEYERERRRVDIEKLEADGWTVHTVWEHEAPDEALARIRVLLAE